MRLAVKFLFYSEEDKEARVDLCNQCKKYIKTVDIREVERLVYPALEHISNLHLDIKAQEMGFSSCMDLYMQI